MTWKRGFKGEPFKRAGAPLKPEFFNAYNFFAFMPLDIGKFWPYPPFYAIPYLTRFLRMFIRFSLFCLKDIDGESFFLTFLFFLFFTRFCN
jgi:hypothetical protein